MSLVEYLKNNLLMTAVGEFKFLQQVGQGGNALVCAFERNGKQFAIKFIDHSSRSKISRFIDEYFCISQIDTHDNIARSYHIENIAIENESYSIIVMKLYASSLKKLDNIASEPDNIKAEKGRRLAESLLQGLTHLHNNRITHRDIKPENIFYDEQKDEFVLGDLGIAHFSEDHSRLANTKKGDRLANYGYSPADQVFAKGPPLPVWDIYAFGQVLSWYLYDEIVHGDGRQSYLGENKELKLLDAIIHRCVKNTLSDCFQSIAEIREFEGSAQNQSRNVFLPLYDLDESIRSSVPEINEFYETTDPLIVERFLQNFASNCRMHEFWYITSKGGDNVIEKLSKLNSERWLLADHYELKPNKLIIYRHNSLYKSLFIILTQADDPFPVVDIDGNDIINRDTSGWESDIASLFRGKYISVDKFKNGYYEQDGEVKKVDYSEVHERERMLRQDAFIIAPQKTGPAINDWMINRDFLSALAQKGHVSPSELKKYIDDINKTLAPEIVMSL